MSNAIPDENIPAEVSVPEPAADAGVEQTLAADSEVEQETAEAELPVEEEVVEACGACRYHLGTKNLPENVPPQGVCRRYPAVVLFAPNGQLTAQFPPMLSAGWCGEFVEGTGPGYVAPPQPPAAKQQGLSGSNVRQLRKKNKSHH